MRKLEVGKGIKRNTRLDEYIRSSFPAMPSGALHKAFRKKDIKIDGLWAPAQTILQPGNQISIYITDAILFGTPIAQPAVETTVLNDTPTRAPNNIISSDASSQLLAVVYEDDNLLVVNKAPGIAVHPDRNGSGVTLIELATEYLYHKCSLAKLAPQQPLLCHRLDRNTGGLVLIAKNKPSLDYILTRLSDGSIKKHYRCIVSGKPASSGTTLTAWLTKDAQHGTVIVTDEPLGRKSQQIITTYRLLEHCAQSNTSLLEVVLQTGRTHQIRAHLAYMGLPIIGDGKYCPNSINSRFHYKKQLLVAYKLVFAFQEQTQQVRQIQQTQNVQQPRKVYQDRKAQQTQQPRQARITRQDVQTHGTLSYLAGRQFEVDDGLPSLSQLCDS